MHLISPFMTGVKKMLLTKPEGWNNTCV